MEDVVARALCQGNRRVDWRGQLLQNTVLKVDVILFLIQSILDSAGMFEGDIHLVVIVIGLGLEGVQVVRVFWIELQVIFG